MTPISQGLWIVIAAIVIVVVVAALAWVLTQRRRTAWLRERFGQEYDRTVQQYGNRRQAEAVLGAREERAKHLHLHPLTPEDRARFARASHSAEAQFVDDPLGAATAAERLFAELMHARGYPDGDFEQHVADLSATYPRLVEDYRMTHTVRLQGQDGQAGTENLRKTMKSYQVLFDGLLETGESERKEAA